MDAYGIMGTWQYVMVYGFGIIGWTWTWEFLPLAFFFGFFFCLFRLFFVAGFLYPPCHFFLALCILFP